MTGNPASDDVGSDLIDAYLISVENALVAAGAPRADRMQVLQNLETQISDMLAPLPLPFSEEAVCAVIARLEPPGHFTAIYGNGGKPGESVSPTPSPSRQSRLARLPSVQWPMVAAASCALLPIGFFLTLLAAASHAEGPAVLFAFLTLLGFVLTPFAIWRAFKQLGQAADNASGRSLVLN